MAESKIRCPISTLYRDLKTRAKGAERCDDAPPGPITAVSKSSALARESSASLTQTVLGALTLLGRDLLAFAITGSAALMWEVGEFIGDPLRGTNVERGLSNTMRDVILGVSGGLLCMALARAIQQVRASRG